MSVSVIRVRLSLRDTRGYAICSSFFIEPMVAIPRTGDLISIENMINEKAFTDKELDFIYGYGWHIEFLNWDKDNKGYFVELNCIGE